LIFNLYKQIRVIIINLTIRLIYFIVKDRAGSPNNYCEVFCS